MNLEIDPIHAPRGTDLKTIVLAILSTGPIRALIRERSDGIQYQLTAPLVGTDGRPLRDTQVVTALDDLAREGRATATEQPHPYDTSEFIRVWRFRK